MKKGGLGFKGRMFLTKEEHETYLKRYPVRYVSSSLKGEEKVCSVCGSVDKSDIQVCHKIPFIKGVTKYRLTPEYLDRKENLVYACKKTCNKSVEWNNDQIEAFLKQNEGG